MHVLKKQLVNKTQYRCIFQFHVGLQQCGYFSGDYMSINILNEYYIDIRVNSKNYIRVKSKPIVYCYSYINVIFYVRSETGLQCWSPLLIVHCPLVVKIQLVFPFLVFVFFCFSLPQGFLERKDPGSLLMSFLAFWIFTLIFMFPFYYCFLEKKFHCFWSYVKITDITTLWGIFNHILRISEPIPVRFGEKNLIYILYS